MVPVQQSGTVIMSLLTEDQLNNIVMMIVEDYGSRLTGGEVSEITGLILENISGFETVDSNTFTQVINEIGRRYDESVRKNSENPKTQESPEG
jgi:CRISPR/Cas system-associated protein Cas10 (large subunit of type III CRISPR-Cas system)